MLETLEQVVLPTSPEAPMSPVILADSTKRMLVALDGEITMESASAFSKAVVSCELQPRDEVILLINSPGGALVATEFIIDELKGIRHVTGYAYGICASAAVLLHQSCKRRVSSTATSFMIHGVSIPTSPTVNVSFTPVYDGLKRLHNNAVKNTLQHVKDSETYKKLKGIMDSNTEHYFSPSAAKKYGMVTTIHPQRTLRWETAPQLSLNQGMTHFVVLGSQIPVSDDETEGKKRKR